MSTDPALANGPARQDRRVLAERTGVVVLVVLGFAALLVALWLVREVVVWLLAAGFLAFSIEPLVRMFQRRGVGRGKATALAFVVIAAVILVFSFAIIPSVVDGAQALAAKIPDYEDQLKSTSAADALDADGAIETAGSVAQDSANFFSGSNKVLDVVGALASGAFAIFMIFTFTLYFLVYGRELKGRVENRLRPSARGPFRAAASEILAMNTGYWYGKFLIGVIAGLTCFVSMKLLGLPYAAPLSLFVAITDLIPNIGATLGMIPVVVVSLLEEPWKGVDIAAILIVYQQLENVLITPKVFKRTVELHPFVSVVSVIVFGALFGLVGALLAVPVTKALQISVAAWQQARHPEPTAPSRG
jgi:predicted PurR-regulated permease PerM